MTAWQAIVLGLLQGLTEFLPVSSSGHLLLCRQAFGLGDISAAFDIMLHMGTLLAVVVCLRRDIVGVFKKPIKIIYLVVATIPAAVAGLLLGDYIDEFFYSGDFLWITFLVTAALLLACEFIETARTKKGLIGKDIKIENAAVMGMMQAAALLPGLSRSGSTIFGGVVSGAKREETAVFSFLMSVPVILGSAILSFSSIDISIPTMLLGVISSFAGGVLALRLMLRVISKANYRWFSLYLIAISIISIFI